MIFIDPTEARDNTRLPDGVIKSSVSLPGLEHFTGADLMLSPLNAPSLKEVTDSRLSQLALEKHTQAGLLVQRKSGRDFTSSIPKLNEILNRMLKWTTRPWLLVCADLKCDREGQCIIDGHPSGFSWGAVEGALCWWQLRGGMVSVIGRDSLIVPWINGWTERLKELQNARTKQIFRPIHQVLGAPDWRDTLASFPGIGATRANLIAEKHGTLAWALSFLSDLRSVDTENKIPGIGIETIRTNRLYMGLKDGEILSPYTLEEENAKP